MFDKFILATVFLFSWTLQLSFVLVLTTILFVFVLLHCLHIFTIYTVFLLEECSRLQTWKIKAAFSMKIIWQQQILIIIAHHELRVNFPFSQLKFSLDFCHWLYYFLLCRCTIVKHSLQLFKKIILDYRGTFFLS